MRLSAPHRAQAFPVLYFICLSLTISVYIVFNVFVFVLNFYHISISLVKSMRLSAAPHRAPLFLVFFLVLQSGASSHAKHGGAYFSAVSGSIKDPIAVPGQDGVQEC